MALWWNGTDTFISFVTHILLTTGMNLIGQTKLLTDYGRYKTCLIFWMSHFPNFTTRPKIWLLMRLFFPLREGWFSNSTYQRNASVSESKFSNSMTNWIHGWHESIPVHGTARDSNPCDSNRPDEEDRRMWPQIIHGQFLPLNCLMTWPRHRFTVVALSGRTGEACHKT